MVSSPPTESDWDVVGSSSSCWEPEVIVIGAGVAGSALAYALSQPQHHTNASSSPPGNHDDSSLYAHTAPRKVLLLERDLSQPDRIVGELLQPGGVAALERLGMKDCLDGFDATPVEGYCVVMSSLDHADGQVKQRIVEIPYPEEEDGLRKDKRGEAVESAVDVAAGGALTPSHFHAKPKPSAPAPSASEKRTEEEQLQGGGGPSFSHSGRKEGRSFHHGRFIDSLRRKVIGASKTQQKGGVTNVRVMEATVKNLIACENSGRIIGVSATFKKPAAAAAADGQALAASGTTESITRNFYAPLTVVADGCFSKFRSTTSSTMTVCAPASAATSAAESDGDEPMAAAAAGPSRSTSVRRRLRHEPVAKVATRSHFVGLILDDVPLPRPHHGTVCLTPSGPVLLYQIADKANETRMLIDVKVPAGSKLPSVGDGSLKRHLEEHYLPHLPEAFLPSIKHALENQRLRTMPNSFLPPKMQGRRGAREGVVMIGDSWNMRHPLTGGGMTVALSDAVLLAGYLRRDTELEDLHDWETIRHRLQDWHWQRKNLSGVVNVLSIALYDLFGADDADLAVLREGCFKYFELGGECVAGPVGLLSALTPKPLLLFYHFFAVALYSIYILFTSPKGRPTASSKSAGPRLVDYPALSVQSVRVVSFRLANVPFQALAC